MKRLSVVLLSVMLALTAAGCIGLIAETETEKRADSPESTRKSRTERATETEAETEIRDESSWEEESS